MIVEKPKVLTKSKKRSSRVVSNISQEASFIHEKLPIHQAEFTVYCPLNVCSFSLSIKKITVVPRMFSSFF